MRDKEVFWGEIAPCDRVVQIYEEENEFLISLERFVRSGFDADERVIVIVTPTHLKALEDRLAANGFDLEAARSRGQYMAIEVEQVLSKFLVNGWPDEERFEHVVTELLAGEDGRRVRVFGEMVAVLWARGENGATVRLEHLWNTLCKTMGFSLFCAYPRIGFTKELAESIQEICAAHSTVIGEWR